MVRRGRVAGVENYTPDDLNTVLSYISDVLPTGANEWEVVRLRYEEYAVENNRADRDLVSLKKQFQGLLNCKKPTGDAKCPESVRVAREIQRRIEEKVFMENDVDDGRAPYNGEDSNSTGPHTPRTQAEQEGDSERESEDERQNASDSEARATFSLSPPPPPPVSLPRNHWITQESATHEAIPTFASLLHRDTGPDPPRLPRLSRRNSAPSNVLQPPLVLPPLAPEYRVSSPRLLSGSATLNPEERVQPQVQEPPVPPRVNNQAAPRASGTSDRARASHQANERVREVTISRPSGRAAENQSQRLHRPTTNSGVGNTSQGQRQSSSTVTNAASGSRAPASTGKRQRTPNTLVTTLVHELEAQSRSRLANASERFLQQQLDAEKEARRNERDERNALSNRLERLQRRNDENKNHFEAQKDRMERQHEESITRMKLKCTELKSKIETLQEKLADERDKSRGLENMNARLEIQLAASRGAHHTS